MDGSFDEWASQTVIGNFFHDINDLPKKSRMEEFGLYFCPYFIVPVIDVGFFSAF